ncbi:MULTISPECIES: septation ring formation regulator EzrA [Bacillaceae]|uniref:Septation ring formation regulator EzrA n=2 Tax=Bacillus infantis TaxID=324767 RepID=U5LGW9_9BACI|nr:MULTISPECIES: septation ring formation regulator EzrA [Bacillus]AGX05842.1 septation ring formation regulator EzrA [Bacillus infantis NRRL B-14911]EAR64309.1 septation ring formation regulator EzrA [Bacillus sp. NRRL B-14911]MCA1036547.1 septation ring formation regulator EzrA [Bacillus infantis]MCK6205123.1 septation ring formation regulator EzrA [Bacillus infantis]MDT0161753.1 septation ring formation regulator EzrA [Bacillus sp. AG4(2022)]
MEYIIGGIVIVIALFLTGYLMKKKYYKEIDRLEGWKMDITDRPVLDEMSKVKQLNMTGQTEELFERWRNEWDDIVTGQLPGVEELLFDAEEYIDRYRFKKAKEVQQAIEESLAGIEDKIKSLLAEINELVGSEEKNRTEIDGLKDLYRECKKALLAHRHTYGKAETILGIQLDEAFAKFQDFEDRTANGDYLQAREIVLTIQTQLDSIQKKMEAIPDLLVDAGSNIPSQLLEVREGFREMEQQGYMLEHVEVDKETESLEKEAAGYLAMIERGETGEAHEGLEDIKQRIDALYDLLEKEVYARKFIQSHDEKVRTELYNAKDANFMLKKELGIVQQSYHLQEKDEETHSLLETKLTKLFKRFEILEHKISNQSSAHSVLGEELEYIKNELEALSEEQVHFAEKLQALRKDELAAREKVKEISKKLSETIRLVSKSNIPGLSQNYRYLMEDTKESIQNVIEKLDEKPLDIPAVQQYLEIAVMTVDKAADSTAEMIETVQLAEKVIQYGNRYRSKYPSIAKALREAEDSFRNYNYKEALEQAASSIEEIEPGALKRIEDMIGEKENA